MCALQDRADTYPSISIRATKRGPEAYVPGTGLAVWEIAWVAGQYGGDVEATTVHLGQSCEVIEEALEYADAHAVEIEAEIARHIDRPLEDMLQELPAMRVIEFDPEPLDELRS